MTARDSLTPLLVPIHIVRGFKKSSTPTIHHETVMDIVARYVQREKIIPTIDAFGKPLLAPVDGVPIFIGLSHVHDILLVALAFDGPVGIDAEIIRPRRYLTQISARYFAEEAPAHLTQFYRAWTAREAFIKCIGSRISLSLARIRTKPQGEHLLIGLDNIYDHVVQFFAPTEKLIVSLCRPQGAALDCAVIIR